MTERDPSPFAGGDPFAEDPSVQVLSTPIWRELLAGLDWLSLRLSPVYVGCGVPRGQGEPVVVVPGFLGNDGYLVELFTWLARVGYRPYFSNIGQNADCPNHLSSVLLETVRRAREETGMPVRLIGHSLGGMLARNLALEYPDDVAAVISLGSPFRDTVRAHPAILAAADALRRKGGRGGIGANVRPSCFSGHCTCEFTKNMLAPEEYEVPHFSVFSRYDGVVDWESCAEEDPALNDEVNCTHVGMAFHPGVFRVIGRRLAEVA
jgi:pimeloyl-ACP methyl ester carboxylesterase